MTISSLFLRMADVVQLNVDAKEKYVVRENTCPQLSKRYLRLPLPRRLLPSAVTFLGSENQDLLPWSQSQKAKSSLLSVLSALYALILVILAMAFEVSGVVTDNIVSSNYKLYYIYLYSAGLAYFAYCYAFLLRTKGWNLVLPFPFVKRASPDRRTPDDSVLIPPPLLHSSLSTRRKVTYSAKIAGSFYLRLGAIVFGIVGVIDRALQIYRVIDYGPISACYGYISLAEDSIGIIFIFVQLYFIFQNSKMTIHRFKEIGRFGCMHLVATNVCLWIKAIIFEEYHIIQEVSHSMQFKSDKSLNDSTMMVKASSESTTTVNSYDCIKIRKEFAELMKNMKPFMTTCIIEYAVICAGVMYIMWRNIGQQAHRRSKFRKQNFQIDCSASTNGLFVGLLFVVFTLVSMIIFFAKVHMERNVEALWVFYFSDCVLYIVSIGALIVAMVRMRNLHYISSTHSRSILLDDILLYVGLVGQLMFCIFSVVALTKLELISALIVVVSLCRMIEVLLQTVFIMFAQRLVALTPRMQIVKPGREMVTFLLMSNLAMFLINIFETQKAGTNPLTIDFFGESFWTIIVHSTVPLSSFYRFHSSVCFAEIWKRTYRFKETEL